ncbi:calmodulin-binding protein 60 A-like isoform X2 [Cornus florida]|uniref:calmodulin-binding protein 60 A-like isoform X2 n=1 Tax=Cornus florida TaxID=4283 RepID=UPI002898EBB8|nr:calmodulin-binding protein 60 A-like isoform X2 [Cornus florida]XP_059641013.1 calmodulin-binding protein 60 A-like isoform X2 [Cornus florida]XP_059641014.1 calmodulin-binding protein 60 A-like isoform X2 [Cornus florida]
MNTLLNDSCITDISMPMTFRNEIHPSVESIILQLHFLIQPSSTVHTGKKIEGEGDASIEVALIDGSTRETVKCGPESSAKVEIVVLEGDCNDVEGHDWTTEEFNQKIVREREGIKGKIPCLTGDAYLNLKEGVGTVDKIKFTHNSKWMKNGDFRLGARVVLDNFSGIKVREAISKPFKLKDRRGALYGKHDTPSLFDEVWRLKNIVKNSPLHNCLSKENITTVKDFLTLYFTNPQRLHEILGAGTKMVEIMINHAQTCILDKTVYLYRPSSQQKNGVVFNVVGQLIGLLLEGQCVPSDRLSKTQKADAQNLVDSAFEHREDFFIEKKHQEDFVSYDDITSLMDSCSETCPTNLPRLETCHYSGTCHIFNGNDNTQPSTSSPVNLSHIAGMDSIVEQSDPGEVPNSPDFDPLSIIQDFDEGLLFLNNDHNPQPENSPRLENLCGHNSGTCHIFNGNDATQPSTSSPVNFSKFRSIGEMVMVDGGFLTIAGMDFIVEQSDPGEVPNSPDFDPLSMIQDFDEGSLFLNNDHNPQPENLAVELPAAEQSATAVDLVEIRWVKLFSVLQCVVKIRSIVRSSHVRKKQRCC